VLLFLTNFSICSLNGWHYGRRAAEGLPQKCVASGTTKLIQRERERRLGSGSWQACCKPLTRVPTRLSTAKGSWKPDSKTWIHIHVSYINSHCVILYMEELCTSPPDPPQQDYILMYLLYEHTVVSIVPPQHTQCRAPSRFLPGSLWLPPTVQRHAARVNWRL